jgi:[NiFe] hydrogenase assembly HybE family chaperone
MSRAFEGSYLGDGSKIADDTRLECGVCWWVYDPALGDEERQIAPGTAFRLLPDTWDCPNCGTDKSKFMVIDSATASNVGAVQNLANAYRRAALNVKGMPIYNPTLAIEAIGFREYAGRHVGVIVTPWFMNVMALPSPEDLKVWVSGSTARIVLPSGSYDFMVTELEEVGLIGSCSLFSTMTEFTDHEAAQLAATTVAEALFTPEEPAAPQPAPTVSRRSLLTGGGGS